MANEVYATVSYICTCAQNRAQGRNQRRLKLIFQYGLLVYVCMNTLVPLPKNLDSQSVMFMTELHTKLTKAIATINPNGTTAAHIFLEHRVAKLGIPPKLLTNNGPQYVWKFFLIVCCTLEVNNTTATGYHPKTNGQVEQFNCTILSRLRHYVSEHRTDWDTYLLPLRNANNIQVRKSIEISLFNRALTRAPPEPPTVVQNAHY